jgi:hypothetical protein
VEVCSTTGAAPSIERTSIASPPVESGIASEA